MLGTLMRLDIIQRFNTLACLFILLQLQLFELLFAKELTCSVTRRYSGDRILFVNYSGTCNEQVNPCQRISNSAWLDSNKGCRCQCNKSAATYREDNRSCVENGINREGCIKLRFKRERSASRPLTVFGNSSSVQLVGTFPGENCSTSTTYYITDEINRRWVEFHNTPTFSVRRKNTNRNEKGYNHFLEWYDGTPEAELFGKIVKVNIQCEGRQAGESKRRDLCIVFKVNGYTRSNQCRLPSAGMNSTASTASTMIVSNKTRPSNETTQRSVTNVVTVATEPATTSSLNKNENLYISKTVALPIWLIAVIAGGAVITTLAVTAIIWIYCKMRQRSRRRKKRRSNKENPLYNNDDDTVITFTTSGVASGGSEGGYARAGSPCRKGYAVLKPGPQRCKSDYQRLLKPGEDVAGYLVPMEQRSSVLPSTPVETLPPSTEDTAIYSEANSPPPQDKVKSKDYDYAKQDDVCVIRSSLENLDENKTNERETGYGHGREHSNSNETDPPSPFYAVVEVADSGGLPADEATSSENELDADSAPEYVEVLPEVDTGSGNPLTKGNCVA